MRPCNSFNMHSASLRLADTPARAEYENRRGMRRLFCLAAAAELKTQVQWMPQLAKLSVFAAAVPGLDLREQLAELIADRAFWADPAAPRTRAAFGAKLKQSRKRLAVAVQDVSALLTPLLEAYHEARLALDAATAAVWRDSVADARGQLAELTAPGFLTATPWTWLEHYPRYLKGIKLRIESLGGGSLARDRKGMDDLAPRRKAYLERRRQHDEIDVIDPELILYRWMLEEFRVSLFAQRLGTALPASAKRLDQQWVKVR